MSKELQVIYAKDLVVQEFEHSPEYIQIGIPTKDHHGDGIEVRIYKTSTVVELLRHYLEIEKAINDEFYKTYKAPIEKYHKEVLEKYGAGDKTKVADE